MSYLREDELRSLHGQRSRSRPGFGTKNKLLLVNDDGFNDSNKCDILGVDSLQSRDSVTFRLEEHHYNAGHISS